MTTTKKVTAIIRNEMLATIKVKLKELGVPHITVDFVQGYENPEQVFEMPDLVTHARIEVLSEAPVVKHIVDCIAEHAYAGTYDDGVITVLPVDAMYHINKGKQVTPVSADQDGT